MKTIILLYLAAQMMTITPMTTVPTVDGVLGYQTGSNANLLLAHSYLAGTHFYDLQAGDIVTAIYSDGTSEQLEVKRTDIFIARASLDAIGGTNFMFDNGQTVSQVFDEYASPETITLITCYAGDKGFAVVTGRIFIELQQVTDGR